MGRWELNSIVAYLRQLAIPRDVQAAEDSQLLERFARGQDETAFAALLERYGPLVWGVCRRLLGDSPSAEDAFQATFLVLVKKAGTIARRESVRSWLHGVARRVAVRAAAGERQRRRYRCPLRDPPVADPAPNLLWEQVRAVLDEEISRLPEKYRLPMVLCYLEGKTNDEAARLLGCPRGTVAVRLARARARLRGRLTRRGLALTTSTLATALAQQTAPAAVPASLRSVTLQAARLAGAAAPASVWPAGGPLSTQVALLVEGVLHAMSLNRVKGMLGLILALVVLATGTGLLVARHAAPTGPAVLAAERPKPSSADPPTIEKWTERATLMRKTGRMVYAVAFSPDGKTLASAGHEVFLWEAMTGKQVSALDGLKNGANAIALSPDGKSLAAVVFEGGTGPGTVETAVRLCDLSTGRVRASVRTGATALTFAPDGKTLAVAGHRWVNRRKFGEVKLLDAGTLRVRTTLSFREGDAGGVAFSADGKLMATAAYRVIAGRGTADVRVWDAATRKERKPLDGQGVLREMIRCVAVSADGKLVASADDEGRVKVWDTATGKSRQSWSDFEGRGVRSLAFSSDNKTLAVGLDPVRPTFRPGQPPTQPATNADVKLWDVTTGDEVATLRGHEHMVMSLAFSPDGKTLASAGAEGTVKLWELTKQPKGRERSSRGP